MYHFSEKKLLLVVFALIVVLPATFTGCITPTPPAGAAPTQQCVATDTAAAGPSPAAGADLAVHFIDVGQGDSVLVQYNGKNMLIDGGEIDKGATVSAYLQSHGVASVDVLVSTHPHSDHIGGLRKVLDTFQVGVVYDTGEPHATQTYEDYLTLIDRKNIKYKVPAPGDQIDFAPGVDVQVLSAGVADGDLNDKSIVLKVTYGSTSFLFTGDAGFDTESSLLKSGYGLRSDVLKVGHHGSKGSSGTSFLKAVKPKYAVIEVGADNPYGHPAREALDRLESAGATVYRTDHDGNVVAVSDGRGITIAADRRAPA